MQCRDEIAIQNCANAAFREIANDPAQRLKELGIRGKKQCEDACPLVNYLMPKIAALGYKVHEILIHKSIGVVTINQEGHKRVAVIEFPDYIQQLIASIDKGLHPELEECELQGAA